jgi:hypothetical protein
MLDSILEILTLVKKNLLFKSLCQSSMAWLVLLELLVLLPTFKSMIMYGPQLLHSLQELNYQVMVLLYLLELVVVYAPLLGPQLQLAPFVC